MRIRAWTPLLLTVAGFAGIGALALYRLARIESEAHRLTAAVGAALYVGWMIWESRVSVREASKGELDHDRGTMELCAAAKIALLIAALAVPSELLDLGAALAAAMAGIALLACGVWLRVAAIRSLGEDYSHRIRTPKLPPASNGPYGWIRHPAYVGTLLIHAGVVAAFVNPFSLAALGLWIVVVAIRSRAEERWLMTFPEYRRYRETTPGGWFPRGKLQSVLPILLSVGFVGLIVALAGAKLSGMPPALAAALGAVVLLYLAWLFGEGRVAASEVSRTQTQRDRGTCELYAAARAATVLSALALPTVWREWGVWYPLGLAIFLGGVALRLTAIRALGRFYSHRVRLAEGQEVVSRGPYRWLRHPAYTGMIVAHLGFVICFFNWVSFAILFVMFLPAVVLRIHVEERALLELPSYGEYARLRRRLIPLVW